MNIIKDPGLIRQAITTYNLQAVVADHQIHEISLHVFDGQEMILLEGREPEYLYILLEGKAKVAPSSKSGKVALLDAIGPMEFLGDIELFYRSPNFHSVISLNQSTFLAIPFKLADQLFESNLEFHKLLSRNFASKVKNSSVRYARTLLMPTQNRIAKHLYDLVTNSQSMSIKIKINQSADYLDISSRHFRRILTKFQEEGILSRNRSSITVLNLEGLKAYCQHRVQE